MAAPAAKDIFDLTGTWILNRQVSDDFDSTLALQGVPWALRKILAFAGVSLRMTQSAKTNEAGSSVMTIHVQQVVTPGSFSSETVYMLDSTPMESSVPIFGQVIGHSTYTQLEELQHTEVRDRLVKEGGKAAIQELVSSKHGGWETLGIWGFEQINGIRYFTRTNYSSRGDEVVVARLVYDYKQE